VIDGTPLRLELLRLRGVGTEGTEEKHANCELREIKGNIVGFVGLNKSVSSPACSGRIRWGQIWLRTEAATGDTEKTNILL